MYNNSYQQPTQATQPSGRPAFPMPSTKKDDKKDLIKNIVIAVLAVITIAFGALFLLKASDYNKLSKDFNDQVSANVAVQADARLTELEKEFDAKYKLPNTKFVGPEDYGRIEFDFPKTWSVYIASDATSGSKYEVYFNPNQVDTINKGNTYALKLEILNETFDSVTSKYKSYKDLSSSTTTIGGSSANVYTGTIPNTEVSGKIAIFKIRDKTVVLTTYSATFESDFDAILKSITFNS